MEVESTLSILESRINQVCSDILSAPWSNPLIRKKLHLVARRSLAMFTSQIVWRTARLSMTILASDRGSRIENPFLVHAFLCFVLFACLQCQMYIPSSMLSPCPSYAEYYTVRRSSHNPACNVCSLCQSVNIPPSCGVPGEEVCGL